MSARRTLLKQVADRISIGVGFGLDPPQYLVPGTKMEVNITKIGTLRNSVEFA